MQTREQMSNRAACRHDARSRALRRCRCPRAEGALVMLPGLVLVSASGLVLVLGIATQHAALRHV
jgi:hypothetical protein